MVRTGIVSDELWAQIEPLFPSSVRRRGGQWRDHRQVLEAIAWRYRTGAPWRDVPVEFGPFQTLWKRHNLWSRDGTYERMLTVLQADVDAVGALDWVTSVDSTVVRAHQHAAGARRAADPSPDLPDLPGLSGADTGPAGGPAHGPGSDADVEVVSAAGVLTGGSIE